MGLDAVVETHPFPSLGRVSAIHAELLNLIFYNVPYAPILPCGARGPCRWLIFPPYVHSILQPAFSAQGCCRLFPVRLSLRA